MQAEKRWGDKLMQNLSTDLQKVIPNSSGLTIRNIYYCKKFYCLYNQRFKIVPQVGAQLRGPSESTILPQVVAQLFSIPWGHHRYIMDKCGDDPDKAHFYVRQTLENGSSRVVLLNWMDSNLYERQGKAFPNETGFSDTNVKYMKRWHSFYYVHFKKSQQDVDQDSQQTADELNGGKGQQVVDFLEMPEFLGQES